MKKNYYQLPNESSNYGILTDASKGWNILLGDKTGRTVSRRVSHGFKDAFILDDMSDEIAEHIVHAGMIASASMLFSRNRDLQIIGGILTLGLILLYLKGE
jgi:hypothetical protein